MEFEEVREYQPGDDVSSIDWNETAHMNYPYVKIFREERELTVLLVVDISTSGLFGSASSKSELIAEIAAVIAFSAIKNQDKIGLILFSDRVEKYVPPKKGTRHVLRIIRELLASKPKGRGTDLKVALSFLGKVQKQTGICFVISDFLCSGYSHELSLVARKHDLISMMVVDPLEVRFPNLNLVTVQDLETGDMQQIDMSSEKIREEFHSHSLQRSNEVKGMMNSLGAGFIEIRTDKPYLIEIRKFFQFREKRFQ